MRLAAAAVAVAVVDRVDVVVASRVAVAVAGSARAAVVVVSRAVVAVAVVDSARAAGLAAAVDGDVVATKRRLYVDVLYPSASELA